MGLKDEYEVIIIGGGISGSILATKLKNRSVLIIEANNRLMNKIYATGNGRCNLTNVNISIENYNSDSIKLVDYIISKYDNKSFLGYLEKCGIYTRDIDGYIYPMNFEASTVVEGIKGNINSDILFQEEVDKIDIGDDFTVSTTKKKKIKAKTLVLAAGSLASKFNNISKNPIELLNIPYVSQLPCLCEVKSNKKYLKNLSGVRVFSKVKLFVNGEVVKEEIGQTQFKKDGLSGIQIFQLSSLIARNREKKLKVSLDYIYDKNEEYIRNILEKYGVEKALQLILPKKLADVLLYIAVRERDSYLERINRVIGILKNHTIDIQPSYDFENAQTCTGGYKLDDFDSNLESKKYKNLYVIGEILNVDGVCGGYNIQWAYSSASIVAERINNDKS